MSRPKEKVGRRGSGEWRLRTPNVPRDRSRSRWCLGVPIAGVLAGAGHPPTAPARLCAVAWTAAYREDRRRRISGQEILVGIGSAILSHAWLASALDRRDS